MKITIDTEVENKECEFCKTNFKPKRRHQKYCCRKCYKKAERVRSAEKNKQRAKEWYANNKEKAKERRKDYYWSNPEKWRTKTLEYSKLNKDKVRKTDNEYKDKIRHDGKRKELLESRNYTCAKCGEKKDSFQLVAHHTTWNPLDHECQELLCRSCHIKIHKPALKS